MRPAWAMSAGFSRLHFCKRASLGSGVSVIAAHADATVLLKYLDLCCKVYIWCALVMSYRDPD